MWFSGWPVPTSRPLATADVGMCASMRALKLDRTFDVLLWVCSRRDSHCVEEEEEKGEEEGEGERSSRSWGPCAAEEIFIHVRLNLWPPDEIKARGQGHWQQRQLNDLAPQSWPRVRARLSSSSKLSQPAVKGKHIACKIASKSCVAEEGWGEIGTLRPAQELTKRGSSVCRHADGPVGSEDGADLLTGQPGQSFLIDMQLSLLTSSRSLLPSLCLCVCVWGIDRM